MDRKIVLGLILTLIIALFIPLYWLREPSRQSAALLRQRHEASLRGAELFVLNCAVCHGDKGQGLIGPALRETKLEPESLRRTIHRGVPGTAMPAWSNLEGGTFKEHQIEDVVTFLRFWEDGVLLLASERIAAHAPPTPTAAAARPPATPFPAGPTATPSPGAAPTATPPPGAAPTATPPPGAAPTATPAPTAVSGPGGDPDKGKALYSAINPPCMACHGLQGEGGFAPALKGTSLTAEQIAAQVRKPRAAMPPYPPDKLSDQDLAHLIAFIQTLK